MDNYKHKIQQFDSLFEAFENFGKSLYAVGGCVRDILLDIEPKDFDFCTDATPTETKEILANHHLKVIPVGEDFGTIATILNKKTYEITTFRVKESYKRGSRHPAVVFGTSLVKDLERRDLTINAIAMDRNGEIIDPMGGVKDLENKELRVPASSYEKTIEILSDDPLRMLRFARFLGRFGFHIPPEVNSAAKECAHLILDVSRERWKAELDAILLTKYVALALQWLQQCGILGMILPETALMENTSDCCTLALRADDCKRQGNTPFNPLQLSIQLLEKCPKDQNMRWAALLSTIGITYCLKNTQALGAEKVQNMLTEEILNRFKFSNIQKTQVTALLTELPRKNSDILEHDARKLAMTLGKNLSPWIQFYELKTKNYNLDEKQILEFYRWKTALTNYIKNPEKISVQTPENLANFLIEHFHLKGKILGSILDAIQNAIIDESLNEPPTLEETKLFVQTLITHNTSKL